MEATQNGKTVKGIIWDGCEDCNYNGEQAFGKDGEEVQRADYHDLSSTYTYKGGLDFSSTVFAELVGEENCGAGRMDGLTCARPNP